VIFRGRCRAGWIAHDAPATDIPIQELTNQIPSLPGCAIITKTGYFLPGFFVFL
jgi:hypothetical protein